MKPKRRTTHHGSKSRSKSESESRIRRGRRPISDSRPRSRSRRRPRYSPDERFPVYPSDLSSPGLAIVLDFFVPGLGLLYLGEFVRFLLRIGFWILFSIISVLGYLTAIIVMEDFVAAIGLNIFIFLFATGIRFYELYAVYQLSVWKNNQIKYGRSTSSEGELTAMFIALGCMCVFAFILGSGIYTSTMNKVNKIQQSQRRQSERGRRRNVSLDDLRKTIKLDDSGRQQSQFAQPSQSSNQSGPILNIVTHRLTIQRDMIVNTARKRLKRLKDSVYSRNHMVNLKNAQRRYLDCIVVIELASKFPSESAYESSEILRQALQVQRTIERDLSKTNWPQQEIDSILKSRAIIIIE